MPPRLQAFLAVVLWGVSFVATKAALREVSPATLVFSRSALGTVLLLATLAARRLPLVPPRDAWAPLALMGFVGVAFHQVLQAFGIRLTSAVHTGWIVGSSPIWSAVLAALVLRERLGPAKSGGLALGFAGVVLVVTRGHPGAGLLGLPATRGDLLVLASAVNWAVYSTIGHGTLRRLGSLRATAGAMTVGALLLLPAFLGGGGWREYAALSPGALAAVLYLGVGSSGLGYLFWYGALERVEASRVAAFLYLEPLVTLATAVALLGEPVGAAAVAGGLLVLVGVALVQRAPGGSARGAGPEAG